MHHGDLAGHIMSLVERTRKEPGAGSIAPALRELEAAVAALELAGNRFGLMSHAALMTDAEAGAFDDANRLLREVERQWLDPEGLPARPFFRNTLIASDRDNGYANVQFPAVVESLRSDDPQS